MSDPLTPNITINTPPNQQPPQSQSQPQQFKSSSVGTPHTTPLQTGPVNTSSMSATNSPVSGMHSNLSSNNLQGLGQQQQQQQQPNTQQQIPQQYGYQQTGMQTSISNNNLGSLINQQQLQQQQQQSTPSIMPTSQQRLISSSCFEFFYIEMIDYIMKSSSDKTQAHKKLDKLGFKVGHRLVERLSLETPLFPELLDAVKFICKVFWSTIFKKTIDGLKTNHKGVFVLTDSKFQWLQHLSFDSTASNKDCSEYVQFAAGLIKGAMSNFGYKCIVSFDIQQVSTCVFTVKIES